MSKIVSAQTKMTTSMLEYFDDYLKSTGIYVKTFEEFKMISIKCYAEECQDKVTFERKSHDNIIYMCQTHIVTHLMEDLSNPNVPKLLNTKINDQKRDDFLTYLQNYNSDLKSFKGKLLFKVSEHFKKMMLDMNHLFQNIDTVVSTNIQKIIDLTSENQKICENSDILNSDSINEFAKICNKIELSDECLEFMEDEIREWNEIESGQEISKINKMAYKLGRKLLYINDWNKSLEIIALIQRLSKKLKPRLHWCQWESNKVHYFDWNENIHKSVIINGLDILKWSRSISIDHNNILLSGGRPDYKIPDINEIKVYKINLESQSFQTLASMNMGRDSHCMTYLNGFYYVLGGIDYHNRIKKCERYSLENDRWEYIADLNHERSSANVVSISKDNCIYIIGGFDNQDELDQTIEKYDAALNNWTLIQIQKPILSGFLGCCLLPNSNFIFIFGGKDINNECQKGCYLFDYKTNLVTNSNPISIKYNIVIDMPVILNHKVYCYFWKSYSERELTIYDIESGVWCIN